MSPPSQSPSPSPSPSPSASASPSRSPITPDTASATTATIETIPLPGPVEFETTVVRPERPNGAGILLLPEILGVNEFLLAKAHDLAGLGYVVSCPDVFWRIERHVALPHDDEAMIKAFEIVGRYAELDADLSAADLTAALAHVRSMVLGKVAVMGYCLGGRLAFEVAVAGAPDACVSYYGTGIAERLAMAHEIGCPALFHFGLADPFIPIEQVDAIEAAFGDRDDVEIARHEAGHAFENLFAPQFANADAAEVSWAQTVTFLSATLGTPDPPAAA